MDFKQLTQEQKEDLRQKWESTKHQNKDGGRSNQQKISAMEAILEEQAHVIAALPADIDTPQFPPLPPPVSQVPRRPLQPPSGFTQHK